MRYALLFAAFVVAGACKDSTPPPPPDPMIGDYVLRAIDGNPPPQIVQEDTSARYSILYGIVRLKSDKSFVDSTDVQVVYSSGQVDNSSDVAHGSWAVRNDTLFLAPVGSDSYSMRVTVHGLELTQDFGGIALVYRK